MRSMMRRIQSGQLAKVIALALLALFAPRYSTGADSTAQVVLNTSKAAPRTVESLTERAILRDYKFAWVNLEQALESNSTAPLSGRSEEHTSELQSLRHLVCRLLLEK